MASKCDVLIIIVEFRLFAYILRDMYVSVFVGSNDAVLSPDHSILGFNATNEDPKIAGIGNFAVDEFNKLSGSDLKLQRVVKAMFAQWSYMLLIQAADGASAADSKRYAAVVMVRGDQMRLAAFQEYVVSEINQKLY